MNLASRLENLAYHYAEHGSYAEAKPFFLEALEIRRTTLGENHPEVAQTLLDLAKLHRAMGESDAAEPLLRQVIEIQRTALERHTQATRTA